MNSGKALDQTQEMLLTLMFFFSFKTVVREIQRERERLSKNREGGPCYTKGKNTLWAAGLRKQDSVFHSLRKTAVNCGMWQLSLSLKFKQRGLFSSKSVRLAFHDSVTEES